VAAWLAALVDGPEAAASAADGDFAVALALADGRVFLAVDRFAVRSICWRVDQGAVRFAERADDIAEGCDLDPQALFDYLYFHAIPAPRTVFAGVTRLPAGHYALFGQGRATVAPYWTPVFSDGEGWDSRLMEGPFVTAIEQAVVRQLDGSTPACFLSGGTDSSTVAGMIGRVTGRPARTYSIGFAAAGYDEMEYARLAARHFGTEHHEHYVTPDDLVAGIPSVAAYYDQPFGNSSALPAWVCARRAREDGTARLLAGDGGDELFGGNTRYAKQTVFGWYGSLPHALRRRVLEPLSESAGAERVPLLRKAASYVRQASVPVPDRLQTYNLLTQLGAATLLAPGFLSRVDGEAPMAQQRAVWEMPRTASPLNRMLAFDWRYTLAENDLPKVTGTTALAGVSVGFPFLDEALVEMALRMPPRDKLRRLQLRWFFKHALRDFLPHEILTKKKHGFGLPFGVWAIGHAGLQSLVEDCFATFGGRGIARPEFLRCLRTELLPAHPGYYGELVWILIMLEQWLRARAPRTTFAD
jgi:asparagine synthase (glutamine-hydrolysing)